MEGGNRQRARSEPHKDRRLSDSESWADFPTCCIPRDLGRDLRRGRLWVPGEGCKDRGATAKEVRVQESKVIPAEIYVEFTTATAFRPGLAENNAPLRRSPPPY